MKRLSKAGFSMIELLVVLLIIGILAAVAAPIFLQNADKSRASEAVAAVGSIRSALRNYQAQNGGFLTVTDGVTYFGTATGNKSDVLGVQIRGVKYFSPRSYTIDVGGTFTSVPTGVTAAQDFVIRANGSVATNLLLSADGDNGAANAGDVANIRVEMDNAGQIIYSTDAGTTWATY